MAALTLKRPIRDRQGKYGYYKVKGSVKCIEGGIAVLASGYCKPGVSGASLVMLGLFAETKDNTAGADGAMTVKVLRLEGDTEVHLDNHGTNTIVQADVGGTAYIEDDHTVGNLATSKSAAGIIQQIDADGGIWISAS